jgi:protein-disulfide isomerase
VSERNDEFYQPWLRDAPPTPPPAPVKRRPNSAPQPNEAGLARDEAPPLGVDLTGYADKPKAAAAPPVSERVKPAVLAAKAGAANGWAATVHGARAFADWTIRLGQRADVPARVAALEIPRRTGELAQRSGKLIGVAASAVAAATGKAGSAAAQQLGKASAAAQQGLGKAVASGKQAGARQIDKLRPPANAPEAKPESGLDRLLAEEPAKADASNLPLFRTAPPAAPERVAPSRASLPADDITADERPARAALPPAAASDAPSALPRWVPLTAAALAVLALTFWAGSRWGGGMSDAEVQELVRDTILANPEIVPQALEKHQANQISSAIDAVRPVLEKPFSGAWIGNAKGDVTLTVFTDYGCVFCRAALPDIDRLVREDKGVKVVFRELPIIAPQSKDAAIAALAAARQGKYDAFHHAMFAAGSLERSAIDAASTRAGVILDGRSDANADARLFEREIDNNLALAQQLGVNATPTWGVGKKMLQGAIGYDALKQAIAAARAAQ